jgi:hypothetical protein
MNLKTPKTLQLMIAKIIEDKSVLDNEWFRECLSAAAIDFFHVAMSLNGGNDTDYNLHWRGKTIRGIQASCLPSNSRQDLDWKAMLDDVKWIAAICDLELLFNVLRVSPHRAHAVSQYGEIRKYREITETEISSLIDGTIAQRLEQPASVRQPSDS